MTMDMNWIAIGDINDIPAARRALRENPAGQDRRFSHR